MANKEPSSVPNTALARIFSSPLDARIQHLNRILSTTSGVDSTFCFVGYLSVFVSSQLSLLSELGPPSVLTNLSEKPSTFTTTYKAKLLELSASSKTLGGICSDVRTFLRMWGLLKVYLGAKAAYLNPPKDSILKVTNVTQLALIGGYFFYENQVYLASKGVIKSITPKAMGEKIRFAIWLYASYIVVDYIRLWRTAQLQQVASTGDEKAVAKRHEEDRAWYRSFIVNSSYFPLCFHWGVEGGSLPPRWADMVVGALGACAGFANFREAARVTA